MARLKELSGMELDLVGSRLLLAFPRAEHWDQLCLTFLSAGWIRKPSTPSLSLRVLAN